MRPWMYAKQELAIFAPERYSCIEASTKSGKTVGCIVWLAEQGMQGTVGRNYWWVAPVYPQAKIAFRRMKRAIPRELYEPNESELTITLANGAVIWFKGADKPDSLYGEDVWGAVIDEASRVKEDAWHAIRSTLTYTQGPVRLIGNVKGRKNWFYRLARKAEAGAPNMAHFKLTAYDAIQAGVLAHEEVEDAKAQLPEDVFKELYLAEPSDDEGNPFGNIRACLHPMTTQPIVWGWDLAKYVDWTVGVGLDRQGKTAGFTRFKNTWEVTIEQVVNVTDRKPADVDATGVGDPILESLQKRGSNFAGFKFTPLSKQQLMEGLAVAIQQKKIGYPDGPIVQELESFEYVVTRTGVRYSAPEGMHDDCVMALALAWNAYRKRVVPISVPFGVEAESYWSVE